VEAYLPTVHPVQYYPFYLWPALHQVRLAVSPDVAAKRGNFVPLKQRPYLGKTQGAFENCHEQWWFHHQQ